MVDLKKRVQDLCRLKNVTSQQLEKVLGFGKGYISKLNSSVPNVSKIQQIADYFEVPLDFLLGRPPFDNWELINADRKNFLRYLNEEPDILDLIWGIDINNPDSVSSKDFISLLSVCVESAVPNEDGSWTIKMKPSHQSKEKAPALNARDERDIQKRLEAILDDLENEQKALSFSGDVMDETTRELLATSLRNSMEIGKKLAKQKFTPKKYRKEV